MKKRPLPLTSYQTIIAISFLSIMSCTQFLRYKQSSEDIVSLKMECQASLSSTKDSIISILTKNNIYQTYKNFDDKVRIYTEFKKFPGPKKGWWKFATQYDAQCQYVIDLTIDRNKDSISHIFASVYIRIRPNEKWDWVPTADYHGYGDDRVHLLSELQGLLNNRGTCE
jgi:hypothetical protein